jgi:hypothetical protein
VNIQRLLDEGSFVATYKFALLLALAELSIERGSKPVTPLRGELEAFRRFGRKKAAQKGAPVLLAGGFNIPSAAEGTCKRAVRSVMTQI